jgi:hypothetical protein
MDGLTATYMQRASQMSGRGFTPPIWTHLGQKIYKYLGLAVLFPSPFLPRLS